MRRLKLKYNKGEMKGADMKNALMETERGQHATDGGGQMAENDHLTKFGKSGGASSGRGNSKQGNTISFCEKG